MDQSPAVALTADARPRAMESLNSLKSAGIVS